MSNYIVTTNFLSKDSLASGNAAKAVKGADLTTEFNNIATMSTTKVDSSSNAALLSLLVTGSSAPNNGLYLPAANTLGLSTNGVLRLQIDGSGNISCLGPTAGSMVDMTADTGTFNMAYIASQWSSPPASAPACVWRRSGKTITLSINTTAAVLTGTSGGANGNAFQLTGLPAGLQPATQLVNVPVCILEDNGVTTAGYAQINPSSGTITLYKGAAIANTTWTASGTKGLLCSILFTYTLD